LTALTEQLKPARQGTDDTVKAQLKSNTDSAIQNGVFGVPSMQVHVQGSEEIFWGLDALPMLRQCLSDDPWFTDPQWQTASGLPVGTTRNPHREK
jgi:hypothetical protein